MDEVGVVGRSVWGCGGVWVRAGGSGFLVARHRHEGLRGLPAAVSPAARRCRAGVEESKPVCVLLSTRAQAGVYIG